MAEKNQYNADQLTVLQGLEAVRKRPGMYVGGVGLSFGSFPVEGDDGVEPAVHLVDATEVGVEELTRRDVAPFDHRALFDCRCQNEIVHAVTLRCPHGRCRGTRRHDDQERQ